MPRTTSAKSVSFSSLFVLKKETFLEILKQDNEDYEDQGSDIVIYIRITMDVINVTHV